MIQVANQIDVDKFRRTGRPEIDYAAIPEGLIYKFLVLHEIGHRLFDIPELCLPDFGILLTDRVAINLFFSCNELRADRYAWKTLFPGEPLPLNPKDQKLLCKIEAFIEAHGALFNDRPREVTPISTKPKEMIPVCIVDRGIPWG